MNLHTDIVWRDPSLLATLPVTAAKLTVLNLGPIKARLGPRWPRLSALVHALFERALKKAHGRSGHFIRHSELCYIATFQGRNPDEAGLACMAVAKEVCELLFGEDSEDISVRSLVGIVPMPTPPLSPADGVRMEAELERHGKATIVTRAPRGQMDVARQKAARLKRRIGFGACRDLRKSKDAWVLLGLESERDGNAIAGAQRVLGVGDEANEMEIALLAAAAEHCTNLQARGEIGAVAVGVAYETLSCFHSRIRYLQAMKAIRFAPSCPLLLKIEHIAPGTLPARLNELATMMAISGVRVLLKFDSPRAIPPLEVRVNCAGIGAALPPGCGGGEAQHLARLLVKRCREQKAFLFLEGLDSDDAVQASMAAGLLFGAGQALAQANRQAFV